MLASPGFGPAVGRGAMERDTRGSSSRPPAGRNFDLDFDLDFAVELDQDQVHVEAWVQVHDQVQVVALAAPSFHCLATRL